MSKSGSPSDKRRRVEPEPAPAKPAPKKPAARKTAAKPEAAPAQPSAKPAAAPKKAPAKKKPARKRAAAKKVPRKVGRPTLYSEELTDTILTQLANGTPLTRICEQEGMPAASTVFSWQATRPEFLERCIHAREAVADKLAAELLAIADDGRNDTYLTEDGDVRVDNEVVQRSRLRVDTRKWLLSKMAPKTYGDRIETHHSGEIKQTSELTDDELNARIAGLIAK